MTGIETEEAVLEAVLPRLKAEGFDVFRDPPANLLPEFMSGYRPDAIAIGQGKKIAIEVVGSRASAARVAALHERFAPGRGWELRVVHAGPQAGTQAIEIVPESSIERSLAMVGQLTDAGLTQAAVLIGWATFEAIGRRLSPEKFKRPQTPGRLVEVLASEGLLTPDEADSVRGLVETRNRLIHGDLEVEVSKNAVKDFTRILRTLLSQIEAEAPAG